MNTTHGVRQKKSVRNLPTKPTRGDIGISRRYWFNGLHLASHNTTYRNSQTCTLGLLFASSLLLPESRRAATQAAPGRAVSLPVGSLGTCCQRPSPPVLLLSKAILNRSFCSKKEKAHEGMYFKISSLAIESE